jgi:hypothetical protein
MLKNAINWIKDRLQERSTKLHFLTLLGALSLLGIIGPEVQQGAVDVVETGQELYQEGVDSSGAVIERGKELIETGRETVEYARDTGSHFWQQLTGLFTLLISLFGMGSKDAKQGVEYEHRERVLKERAEVMGVDLDKMLPTDL